MVSTRPGDDPTPRAGEGGPRRTATQLASDPAFTGTYAPLALRYSRRFMPRPDQVDVVMATPPTVSAASTTSGITSGILIPSVTVNGSSISVPTDRFAYRCAGSPPVQVGTSFPNSSYVTFTSLTTTNASTAPFCVDFMHDGTQLELFVKGNGASFRVRVDGQLVAAASTTIINDGSQYYVLHTFGSRAPRRITVEGNNNLLWGGVQIGPNDSVWRPDVTGPRVIAIGDSFTEGTGATTGNTNWVAKFREVMGWPDTWSSGVGGTGYLNPGSGRVKFRDRLTNDVTQWKPDIVIWAGGLNDQGTYTAAAIQAEAAACYAAVQAAVPGVTQIVLSPFWKGGVEGVPLALLDAKDGIKAAAQATSTTAQPVYFVDVIEMPLGESAPVTTTLQAGVSANATTISLPVVIARRSTIEIDTGTTRERRVITNTSGSGPYTHTVAALTNAHSSGAVVKQVGPCFWTGAGKVGSTTGAGNADLLVSSDGTHPTQAGHDELGWLIARLIARQVLPA